MRPSSIWLDEVQHTSRQSAAEGERIYFCGSDTPLAAVTYKTAEHVQFLVVRTTHKRLLTSKLGPARGSSGRHCRLPVTSHYPQSLAAWLIQLLMPRGGWTVWDLSPRRHKHTHRHKRYKLCRYRLVCTGVLPPSVRKSQLFFLTAKKGQSENCENGQMVVKKKITISTK